MEEPKTKTAGRNRALVPEPKKLDVEKAMAMHLAGRSAGEIVFEHASRGIPISRSAVCRFINRWKDEWNAETNAPQPPA